MNTHTRINGGSELPGKAPASESSRPLTGATDPGQVARGAAATGPGVAAATLRGGRGGGGGRLGRGRTRDAGRGAIDAPATGEE